MNEPRLLSSVPKASPQFPATYLPIDLDPTFPIFGGSYDQQTDAPIQHLHFHRCLEIGLCVSGSGLFVIGEKVLEFSAGDVTVITENEVHLAQSGPGTTSEWFWTYVEPATLCKSMDIDQRVFDRTRWTGPAFSNIIHPNEAPELTHIVTRLVDELKGQRFGHHAAVRALVVEILVAVHRARRHGGGRNEEVGRGDYDRIAPAINIITTKFMDRLTVRQLAAACNLSEPHFRRLFTSTVAQSPRDYWVKVRLRMAVTMLQSTSIPIERISKQVGFTSLSSFNRLFSAQFGQTPHERRAASSLRGSLGPVPLPHNG